MQISSFDRLTNESHRLAEKMSTYPDQIKALKSMQIRFQEGSLDEKGEHRLKGFANGIIGEVISDQRDLHEPTPQRRDEICEQIGSELFDKVKQTPRASAETLLDSITRKVRGILETDTLEKKRNAVQ